MNSPSLTLSQVSQLPLVFQRQQHYFDFGVGIQNDVAVYDVFAQIRQAVERFAPLTVLELNE